MYSKARAICDDAEVMGAANGQVFKRTGVLPVDAINMTHHMISGCDVNICQLIKFVCFARPHGQYADI